MTVDSLFLYSELVRACKLWAGKEMSGYYVDGFIGVRDLIMIASLTVENGGAVRVT